MASYKGGRCRGGNRQEGDGGEGGNINEHLVFGYRELGRMDGKDTTWRWQKVIDIGYCAKVATQLSICVGGR